MFFPMFLNAITVLYDYPGGGVLSSCFCMITCSLYGKSSFKCNIAESWQIVSFFFFFFFSFFKTKVVPLFTFGLFVLFHLFLFNLFFFLILKRVSCCWFGEAIPCGCKTKWFLKKKGGKKKEDPKGRTFGRGAQYFVREFFLPPPPPHRLYETFMNIYVFVPFLIVG